MKLAGKRALITGGSHGLGKEIARHFLMEGASTVICARNSAALESARQDLETLGDVRAKVCDVSSEQEVAELAEFCGPVDVLVCNAGVYGPKGPSESVDFREWVRAIEINLFGTLLPCRAVIPGMKAAGRGKIVILSGGGATSPMPNLSAYAASKAAVVRTMETLAEELKECRIDVNAIAPGALNTRFLDEALEAGPEKVGTAFYEKMIKQKESGGVPLEKGAALCVYLASDESDGISGKLISAQWDPWATLARHRDELRDSDIYTLRRIVPGDRGKRWD